MRAPAIAVLWLATACAAEPSQAEVCAPRIERMREQLTAAYVGDAAPSDLPAWVRELYLEIDASTDMYARAALLEAGIGRTIDGCYGLADAFRAAASAPAGARRAAMAREVPAALTSCRCRGVDVESLAFLLRLSPSP